MLLLFLTIKCRKQLSKEVCFYDLCLVILMVDTKLTQLVSSPMFFDQDLQILVILTVATMSVF